MFVLRIIEETRENGNKPFEQVITNYEVGKSYSVLRKGITKEFDAAMESYPEAITEDILAVLCSEIKYDDNNMFSIMASKENRKYSYFVMTESGKTFDRL